MAESPTSAAVQLGEVSNLSESGSDVEQSKELQLASRPRPDATVPTEVAAVQARTSSRRAGRRKIPIEFIEDKSRRHITFSKRKAGIMKKAYELSTLTGTQVLLLVASETGHVYTFATPKLQPLITKADGKNLIQACLNAPESSNQLHGAQHVPEQPVPQATLQQKLLQSTLQQQHQQHQHQLQQQQQQQQQQQLHSHHQQQSPPHLQQQQSLHSPQPPSSQQQSVHGHVLGSASSPPHMQQHSPQHPHMGLQQHAQSTNGHQQQPPPPPAQMHQQSLHHQQPNHYQHAHQHQQLAIHLPLASGGPDLPYGSHSDGFLQDDDKYPGMRASYQRGGQPIYSPYNVGSSQNPYAAMGYSTAPQAQSNDHSSRNSD